MDKKLFGGGGTSDPVVTFRLGHERCKSTVAKKTLAPEWGGETFALHLHETAATADNDHKDEDVGDGDEDGGSDSDDDAGALSGVVHVTVEDFDLTGEAGGEGGGGSWKKAGQRNVTDTTTPHHPQAASSWAG